MRTSINFAIRDMHKNTVLSIALLFLSLPALGQQKINYVVLDGKKWYQGDELGNGPHRILLNLQRPMDKGKLVCCATCCRHTFLRRSAC